MEDNDLLIIMPRESGEKENARLAQVLDKALANVTPKFLSSAAETEQYLLAHPVAQGAPFARVLFAADLGDDGINLELSRLLSMLRHHPHLLEGWLGGVIIDAQSELYTKSMAQELVLAANMSGCAFVGRSLVEGTGTLRNFTVAAHKLGSDN